MKRYRVDLSFTSYNTYIVDAENEQDAIDKAAERYDRGEEGQWDGCDPERWPEADMAEELAPEDAGQGEIPAGTGPAGLQRPVKI